MGCCITFQGITRDCTSSIGGIKRAWGACYDEISTPTITDDMISLIPNPQAWKLFEFRNETGSVTTDYQQDDTTGSKYWESTIVFQFTKMETVKRLEINALAQSDTAWIIEDNNGRYWYFGYDDYVILTDGTAETGTARADLNGYNITLLDTSKDLPYEVSDTAMEAIINPES